jgi:hypothetical protein
MIMEYQIVSGNGWTPDSAVKELEKRVLDLLKEGWEPVGGMVMTSFNENAYQTLIRRSSDTK